MAAHLIFDLSPDAGFGAEVARAAGAQLSPHEMRLFAGGQHLSRPLVSVRGQDVVVIARLAPMHALSTADLVIRLLMFLATCRDHGAGRLTAVLPWLPVHPPGAVDLSSDPASELGVDDLARLIEIAGCQTLITLDAPDLAALQNAFRCRTIHLEGTRLFAPHVAARLGTPPATVFAARPAGMKRAELLRKAIAALAGRDIAFGFADAWRPVDGLPRPVGPVAGNDVWILDDLVGGGQTALDAAATCRRAGAASVHVMATHAILSPAAVERLMRAADSLILTDTTGAPTGPVTPLTLAPFLGDCLSRLHADSAIGPALDPSGQSR